MDDSSIIALIALVVSVVIGVWQLVSQTRTNKRVHNLELQQRHEDLTPDLRVSYEHKGGDTVQLKVALTGPVGLPQLDGVAIAVRDDRVDRTPVTAGSPTAEEIKAQIWGPYRLRPGVDGADEIGRTSPARPVQRGEALYFLLEPTLAPPWASSSEDWRSDYRRTPVRLTFTCVRGEDEWIVPAEVVVEPEARPWVARI